MFDLKTKPGKKALVIVAHPDDETIWMGGFILLHPELDWTIFSLCRASDPDRAPKFRRICEIFRAKAIISDVPDENDTPTGRLKATIKLAVKKKIGSKRFDYIFTHGANGEYGHPVHKEAHLAVTELLKKKILHAQMVWYFNYKKESTGKRPSMTAKRDSDFIFPLSGQVFQKKKRLQAEVHGYAWNGIDNSMCTNPEAFIIRK
ncbi:MAG: PIG-L family deacetylase [Planctomycetes bacterium]|jgi:LmbE family N-acetylglucosaminyl deacetylase|nr:PIG-L family deacetylase [Planctomycetota bacterium]